MRSHIKFEVCAVFCVYLFLVSMVNAIVTADKREERKVKSVGIGFADVYFLGFAYFLCACATYFFINILNS